MSVLRKYWYLISLVLILIVAAWLRLRDFDLSAFNIDEAIASIYCIQFVFKGDVPVVGVKTSIHFYNSPLLIYLLAPFYAISTNPLLAQGFIAALGLVLVGLAARLGRLSMGKPYGLILATLFAFSVICVLTSRRLWGHSFIPLLSTFVFYHTWRWMFAGKDRSLFFIPTGILWAQQLHFSGALLWVNVALMYYIFKPRFHFRFFLMGCLLGALPYVPYFFHTGLSDAQLIIKHIITGADKIQSDAVPPIVAVFAVFGDFLRNDMMGTDVVYLWNNSQLYQVAVLFMTALLIISLAFMIAFLIRQNPIQRPAQTANLLPMMCIVWMAVPVVAFSLLKVSFVPFYLLPILPAPMVCVAWFIKYANERHRWFAPFSLALISLWTIGQLTYQNEMWNALRSADSDSRVQTSFRYRDQTVRWISEYATGNNPLILQADRPLGRGLDYSWMYLIWRYWGDESPQLMNRDNATVVFVIRDSKDNLSAELRTWLEQHSRNNFGNVTLYEIPASEMKFDYFERSHPPDS